MPIQQAIAYCTSCDEHKRAPQVGDRLISTESDFGLTEGKTYTVTAADFGDVEVTNDRGVTEMYTAEYFVYDADVKSALAVLREIPI